MPRRQNEHAIESLRAALKSLRTRHGLTVDRLRATELGLGPLLDLDVVQQVQHSQQVSPEEAIVAVVRGAAAQLDVADLLVVDAALALGVFAESVNDQPGLAALYAPDLSERRQALVASWATLHELAGTAPTPAPTVRALRGELESRAFVRLAERILSTSPLDVPSTDESPVPAAREPRPRPRPAPAAARNGAGGRVLVAGAAVIDHIHAVDRIPEAGTSIQARSYQAQPGGKGLNQAVAAARLGLTVQLVATVGDDEGGRQVLDYLEEEGVGTDLIRVVPGASTPVTTVLVTPDGMASTVGWMNDEQISVTVRDVRSARARATLAAADTVMLTFELPHDTIAAVLEATAASPSSPRTILTPSPPDEGLRFAHEILQYVDYLVGTHWELCCLLPTASAATPTDQLLTQLLILGAGTICLAESFRCTVRSNVASYEVAGPPAAFKEAPGARDAFAAALALRLHEGDGQLDEEGATWATAAMAVPQTFGGVASSMPTRDEIDRVLGLATRTGGVDDR
ncbi:MAG TPA: PfkB family carbohydrate kinase [Acidimicrobiales bacterium]